MPHAFHPRQKFKIVQVLLLVPDGEEAYMDLLSDYRDDSPDQLVQWSGKVLESGLTVDLATLAWERRAEDLVTIHTQKDDHGG